METESNMSAGPKIPANEALTRAQENLENVNRAIENLPIYEKLGMRTGIDPSELQKRREILLAEIEKLRSSN